VEAGEEVIITRRGKAVAKLTAPNSGCDRERAHGAVARIRACRHGTTLAGIGIRDLINEGGS
jgi:antitoxin (DNA-binding transcriptional repressor) of toxin-antitoxin stability system